MTLEEYMKEPVRCCIYLLRPKNTLPSLYRRRKIVGTPFSFVPLHFLRREPILCFEKTQGSAYLIGVGSLG